MAYLSQIAAQLGVSLWLLVVIFIWSYIWKLFAFWKSARKGHWVWFLVFAIVNTIGILEILYIYVFSEMTMKAKKRPRADERKRRK